ncbi:hypothetical protein FACS189483_03010 [Spirochaetia bacterium]|nr:hypothetical protein FACS189483_03010 [Spirochaetia bacterium]
MEPLVSAGVPDTKLKKALIPRSGLSMAGQKGWPGKKNGAGNRKLAPKREDGKTRSQKT